MPKVEGPVVGVAEISKLPYGQLCGAEPSEQDERLTWNDGTVVSTVKKWWDAWAKKELAAIASMASENYLELTKGGRPLVIGRKALLEKARKFFRSAQVNRWEIRDPVVEFRSGEAAVCTYYSVIMVSFGDSRRLRCCFDGVATDVLICESGVWKYLSHFGGFHPDLLLKSCPRDSDHVGAPP